MSLTFYYGTMGCGKTTLAIQHHHNYRSIGRQGRLLTAGERVSGEVMSRLGPSRRAVEISHGDSLFEYMANSPSTVDFLVIDEAQFLDVAQVEELGELADVHFDIQCYGLLTDFRGELFPGSKALVETADHLVEIPTHVLCWCGEKAIRSARVVNGRVTHKGEQILVGDTTEGEVYYAPLCRRHHRVKKLVNSPDPEYTLAQ